MFSNVWFPESSQLCYISDVRRYRVRGAVFHDYLSPTLFLCLAHCSPLSWFKVSCLETLSANILICFSHLATTGLCPV